MVAKSEATKALPFILYPCRLVFSSQLPKLVLRCNDLKRHDEMKRKKNICVNSCVFIPFSPVTFVNSLLDHSSALEVVLRSALSLAKLHNRHDDRWGPSDGANKSARLEDDGLENDNWQTNVHRRMHRKV